MAGRLPRLTAREVTSILLRHGFLLVSQQGSHQKWRHPPLVILSPPEADEESHLFETLRFAQGDTEPGLPKALKSPSHLMGI